MDTLQCLNLLVEQPVEGAVRGEGFTSSSQPWPRTVGTSFRQSTSGRHMIGLDRWCCCFDLVLSFTKVIWSIREKDRCWSEHFGFSLSLFYDLIWRGPAKAKVSVCAIRAYSGKLAAVWQQKRRNFGWQDCYRLEFERLGPQYSSLALMSPKSCFDGYSELVLNFRRMFE